MTLQKPFSRRALLAGSASWLTTAAWPGSTAGAAIAAEQLTAMGLVIYCRSTRRSQLKKHRPSEGDLFQPLPFLNHVLQSGAGGAQLRLGNLDASAAADVRDFSESHNLFIEAIASVPDADADAERFDAEVRTAVAVGAHAVRTTIIPGRRYEYFDSLQSFRERESLGIQALERAARIVDKHRMPLAVENHKDQRDAERVALFERISSEFVGACLDTGNSFALLEDPVETARRFAPWTHAVHLKDQAVQMYDDGFLLADIPLGEGCLPLKQIVEIVRGAKPDMRFCLELITRDPLKVPVLSDTYWRTFPDVPAVALARTLKHVRDHSSDHLQYVSAMNSDQQLATEDDNVHRSIVYAREQLSI